uniref:Tail tape measure n=1 Tax=Siphoviridae sp. ctj7819 TaxID=2827277 RepID=A0A8S5R4Q5_9CAUD|nr:MAG TPA: tail tape measure [Siphoviridae sp. ctj7819]
MPNINTKFSLSGEKEYKAAISQIGDGMRVLNSEMRKVESEYIKNADSVDALRAKSDVFSKKIGEQKEKIEITRKALEQATKAQEAANEKFQKAKDVLDKGSDEYKRLAQGVETATKKAQGWQVSLNNAEAELNKMNAELEENNDALEKAGANGTKFQQAMEKVKDSVAKAKEEGTGAKGIFANLKESFANGKGEAVGLGDAIGGAADKLGVQLPEGASKALNSLNGINAGTAAAVGGFAALIAAVVKAEKKLMSITKESAEYAKEVKTLASVTGQSTEQIQEFQYASDMIGVSYDRVKDSLKEITNKMQEAQNGSEDTAGAFKTLGVEIENTDGSLRSADSVFYDVIDSLGNMHNQAQRDALAMDLMSESAQELNPLIEVGSEGLKQYTDEAHEMGYVLDNEAIAALTATDTAQQKLLKTQEAVTKQISAEYAPYMTEALGDTADFIQKIGKAFVESGVVDKFGSILSSATQILEPLGDLTVAVLPALDAALKPIATTMALIADTTNLLVGLLTLNGDKIRTALGLNISSGQLSNMQQLQYKGALSSGMSYVSGTGYTGTGGYMGADGKWHQNAAGTDNFIGGVTWVGENGPEPVWLPQGSRIGTNQEGRSLSGGDTYNFYVQANEIREIDDFIRRMKNQRRVARMGVT